MTPDDRPRLMWFRQDLRVRDNPALMSAAADGRPVLAMYVWGSGHESDHGAAYREYLRRSLDALNSQLGGRLLVRVGDPGAELIAAAATAGATEVHITAEFTPKGRDRDARVERELSAAGVELIRTGSRYAVGPGRVRKSNGEPYRVFTPFYRAWAEHGWRAPAGDASNVNFVPVSASQSDSQLPPTEPIPATLTLPDAGEDAALRRLTEFLDDDVERYHDDRDRPDLAGTSRLSPALNVGELHPRTALAALARISGQGADTFRKELAWREFYADVLHHNPASEWESLDAKTGAIVHDDGADADAAFTAWQSGRTGYPVVDAGMRQLSATGWMHNRVRMITASFLVKDLHLPWQRGAAHFLDLLIDGDIASNNHGWQWVAGVGTDAAPYFRVFNPTLQGRKLDPDGAYVRRWVPELSNLSTKHIHEPDKAPGGRPAAYPEPLVDHAAERTEALRRYQAVR